MTPPADLPPQPPVNLARAVAEAEAETEPPGGPFSTWNSLYAAVLVTLLGVIALLWFLTELLDHSAP